LMKNGKPPSEYMVTRYWTCNCDDSKVMSGIVDTCILCEAKRNESEYATVDDVIVEGMKILEKHGVNATVIQLLKVQVAINDGFDPLSLIEIAEAMKMVAWGARTLSGRLKGSIFDINSGKCKLCGAETLWGDAPHASNCAMNRWGGIKPKMDLRCTPTGAMR